MNLLNVQNKVLVTGGTGMVGRALQEVMPNANYVGSKYDLTKFEQAKELFLKFKPEYVIHLAARVSGLKGNMEAIGEHYTENVLMNTNVLEVSRIFNVKKLLSVLSTCVYPDNASFPLVEEDIHQGEPYSINLGYGFSKRMVEVQSRVYRRQYKCNYINILSNNVFGKYDNFHLVSSHVIPGIIRKIYEAKKNNIPLSLWGDGSPLREFTYSTDLGKIIVFAFNKYNGKYPINVGNPVEHSIKELAEMICEIMDYKESIIWNTTVSNGQPRKPSSNKKFLDLGWKNENYTDFKVALEDTCEWFLDNYPKVRGVE